MTDAPTRPPGRTVLPRWIRAPQDFVGGVVLIVVGAFALWAASDLQGMRGISFGPATAPRILAVLLLGLGALLAVTAVVAEGEPLARFSWRGPLFIGAAILSFALAIRPLGLIVAALSSFLIAALGTAETRWGETIIVGIVLTAACSLLFPYALGLPFELLPSFLTR